MCLGAALLLHTGAPPSPPQVLEYNRANREVAILCNHQRTVPRAFAENWEKLVGRDALLEKQLEELREMRAQLDSAKAGKGAAAAAAGLKLKSEDAKRGEKVKADLTAEAKKELAKRRKDKAPENDAERLMRLAEEESHLFATKPEREQVVKRIAQWEVRGAWRGVARQWAGGGGGCRECGARAARHGGRAVLWRSRSHRP